MINPGYFGILAGLVFGLVLVWQGAGAAFAVMGFALLGWLVGLAVLVGRRAAAGEIDIDALKQLIAMLFSGARRG